jgi:pimeloyl-ACP methyl ester carboxylesterase
VSGLRPPPKRETPSRIAGRFLFLILLLAVLAAVIWAAVVNQRIPLVENVALDSVETTDHEMVDEVSLNIQDLGESGTPVVLLHDSDLAGLAIFTDLVAALGEDVRTVAVDLPGFGLSTRLPGSGLGHTVADMAKKVSAVIETRSDVPVVIVGVGLGGEVGAEIAVTRPELVAGLAMIDVDFYSSNTWIHSLEKLPWFGMAITYAFETRGTFSESEFAPYCEVGGWCPSDGFQRHRELTTSIVGSTESVNGFRTTPPASDVPSRLGDITAPTVYLWSSDGAVPEDSVDRVVAAVPGIVLERFDAFQAHLDEPDEVAGIVENLLP